MSFGPTEGFEERMTAADSHSKKRKQILQQYFVGPRDIARHSKWPHALRMHGSVFPKLVLPTICVCAWAAIISCISRYVQNIHVNPIIITVLGIVVGLALNFRCSTAYERYMDGRRLWSHLGAVTQNIARVIWTHAGEREGHLGKEDLLGKVACLNLLIAFSVALKHKLRFEPYIQYDDLEELVSHLDTFAKAAGEPTIWKRKVRACKKLGELLRIPMARSNPRKELKRAKRPLGNLPLEILTYLSSYVDEIIQNGTFPLGIAQTHALNGMQTLHEILAQSDRVLNTPLPLAYSIAISQITWIYILSLPFQLVNLMDWMSIPVTTCSAYIVLGFHAIGNEIENPFGPEVNDLPMEVYCAQIASDITIIAAQERATRENHFKHPDNKPLYPISSCGYDFWAARSKRDIREALHMRACIGKCVFWKRQNSVAQSHVSESASETACGDCEEGTCGTQKRTFSRGTANAVYSGTDYSMSNGGGGGDGGD